MAINKNHEIIEINNQRCALVEKNINYDRLCFLENILKINGYNVLFEKIPNKASTPKSVVAEQLADQQTKNVEIEIEEQVSLYNIGVDDLSFNCINAIFGRKLKDETGQIIQLEFWLQTTKQNINKPYFYK